MKLATFQAGARAGLGFVDEAQGRVMDVSAAAMLAAQRAGGAGDEQAATVRMLATLPDMLHGGDEARELVARLAHLLSEAGDEATVGRVRLFHSLDAVRLMAPVPRPGKIIAIGLNYREHIEEQSGRAPEAPIIFSKFASAVIGPGEAIQMPALSRAIDYEGELAVIIGGGPGPGKDIPADQALAWVAGYTILNDVTARDLQKADRQWVRAKSIDTFCPMGPWMVTADAWEFPPRRAIQTRVNGEVRQSSHTERMIHDVAALVSYCSQAFTLDPGDVIATGTPSGVGVFRDPPVFLKPGDMVEIEIDGLGILRSPVIEPGS